MGYNPKREHKGTKDGGKGEVRMKGGESIMQGGTVHSFIANSTYKQSPYLVVLYSTHCPDTK